MIIGSGIIILMAENMKWIVVRDMITSFTIVNRKIGVMVKTLVGMSTVTTIVINTVLNGTPTEEIKIQELGSGKLKLAHLKKKTVIFLSKKLIGKSIKTKLKII